MKTFLCSLCVWVAMVLAHGDTIVWTNSNGGNWSSATNWSPGRVPGAADTAVITTSGNYTVTMDTNASVSGFILGAADGATQKFLVNGQTLSLGAQGTINAGGQFNMSSGTLIGGAFVGDAVLTGTWTCSGGALLGNFTIASNAVLNLTAFNYESSPQVTFYALVLTNYGTVVWSNLDLGGSLSPRIYNYGLWDAKTNNAFYGSYQGSGTAVFNNYGSFRKSGGSPFNSTYLDSAVTFNNWARWMSKTVCCRSPVARTAACSTWRAIALSSSMAPRMS